MIILFMKVCVMYCVCVGLWEPSLIKSAVCAAQSDRYNFGKGFHLDMVTVNQKLIIGKKRIKIYYM